MSIALVLKLFLVPFLIYMITLAGRRWGPGVAGWLSAFPVVAGPILLTISLEHGESFAATAAEGTLLAAGAILVFCLAYAWASCRLGVAGAMTAALLAYSVAVVLLQAMPGSETNPQHTPVNSKNRVRVELTGIFPNEISLK